MNNEQPKWVRHPTKATAYIGDQLVAEVLPSDSYSAYYDIILYRPYQKQGANNLEDGIGIARAILASRKK